MGISWCKKVLHGIWVGLLKVQIFIMLASFLVCVTCMFIEVIFRYILEIQIYGFEELAAAVCIWLYLMGAGYGTYEGSHLRIELTHLFLKTPRSEAKGKAVISLISLGLASYMLIWAYDYLIWGLTKGEYLRIGGIIGDFPAVYSQAAIFVGFNLMFFYFIVECIKNTRAVFQK